MGKTTITFIRDSVLKHSPDPSGSLESDQKDEIRKGESILVSAIRPDMERGHYCVTLDQDGSGRKTVDGRNTIYIFGDHTNYVPPDISDPTVAAPASSYNICDEGIKLIKHYEGYRNKAYLCSANVWTLGLGSTRWFGKPVRRGMTCTMDEAMDMFRNDIKAFERGVVEGFTRPVTQGQFSAAVSFAYNCGVGAFQESTLLRRFNAGEDEAPRTEFMRWTNGGLQGLVYRRRSEVDLFYTGKFKPYN